MLDKPNFQGNAAVNYTDRETPWTRIIEHKWFEFGKDDDGNDIPKTVYSGSKWVLPQSSVFRFQWSYFCDKILVSIKGGK